MRFLSISFAAYLAVCLVACADPELDAMVGFADDSADDVWGKRVAQVHTKRHFVVGPSYIGESEIVEMSSDHMQVEAELLIIYPAIDGKTVIQVEMESLFSTLTGSSARFFLATGEKSQDLETIQFRGALNESDPITMDSSYEQLEIDTSGREITIESSDGRSSSLEGTPFEDRFGTNLALSVFVVPVETSSPPHEDKYSYKVTVLRP